MDSETQRDDNVDAYWRRRVVALGAALAGVGLLVWGCSGSGGGHGKQSSVQNAAAVSAHTATPAPTPSGAAAMPMPTVTVTAQVTVVPTPQRRVGDACEPGAVVVSLTPTQDAYGGGRHPQFRLSVVNTGQRACTFGVGPNELQLQISSGADRVWTSARCFAGTGSSIQMLRRGIPYTGLVDWDRHRSPAAGGCSAQRPAALPGTYTVVARGGGVKTARQVFRLR